MSKRVWCFPIVVALLLGPALVASAGEPPVVVGCGATPFLVTYNDPVTFWADIADPDGAGDVVSVWLIYQFMPFLQFAETDMEGHWLAEWTIPNLPRILLPGEYMLAVVATDSEGNASELAPLALSIVDHDPSVPVLLSPPIGALIWRGMGIPFEWSIVPNATGYEFEIMLPDSMTVSVELPFFITSLVVNPRLAAELPDGEFFWRVRAAFSDGWGEWSDPFSFVKNCQHGEPIHIEGYVVSVDPLAGTLEISNEVVFDDRPGQEYWGWWTVVVAEQTLITRDGQQIPLANVFIGDYAFANGWVEAWPSEDWLNGVMTATEIAVTSPPDYLSGFVQEILPGERAFWLAQETYGPEEDLGRMLVRLTADALITRMGMPIDFGEIRIGDWAFAEGHWRDGTQGPFFEAYNVDVSFDDDKIYLEGSIESIYLDQGYFMLLVSQPLEDTFQTYEAKVWITRSTVITRDGFPASFHDLAVRDWAFVEGMPLVFDGVFYQEVEALNIEAYSGAYQKP